MMIQWRIAFALTGAVVAAVAGQAAELPSQHGQANKPKKAEAGKSCNVAGFPGVLAANGVCVRFSGYVSSQFSAGQLK